MVFIYMNARMMSYFKILWKCDDEIDEMVKLTKHGSRNQITAHIKELEKQMKAAAKEFDFERAIELRDIILEMKANMN